MSRTITLEGESWEDKSGENTAKNMQGEMCLELSDNRERTSIESIEDMCKDGSRGVGQQPKGSEGAN